MKSASLNRVCLSLLFAGAVLPLSADIVMTTGGVTCAKADSGLCTAVSGATTITFDGLLSTTASGYTDGIATYSWSGSTSPFVKGSTSTYAAPPGDKTTYLTVGSGGGLPNPVTITFSTPMSYFGMYLGSPDSYNVMAFSHGTLIKEFSGFSPGNGNQELGYYLNFRVVGPNAVKFDKIVMSSTQAAMETDNHAYSAPDGGMTLMLLGGALVGIESLRRRLRA